MSARLLPLCHACLRRERARGSVSRIMWRRDPEHAINNITFACATHSLQRLYELPVTVLEKRRR